MHLLTRNEGEKENLNIYDTFLRINALKCLFFQGNSFMISNIVLYLRKNKCLKLKLKNYPLN